MIPYLSSLDVGRWTLGVGRCGFSSMTASLHAITSVAYKEFLHIYRDKRVLLLLLLLPPLFVLLFGYAFESSDITDIPGLLVNRDNTPRTQRFIEIVLQ